jgi:hypothetical protein
MRLFPPGLEPVKDLSPSVWMQEALKDWPAGRFHVRDLVPRVFEAYARTLHRPHRPGDSRIPTGTWAERAAELGRPLGPETTWRDLDVARPDGSETRAWSLGEGSLSEREAAALASILEAHTSTPGICWFATWSGWGLLGGSDYLVQARGMFPGWRARRRADVRARRERRELAKLSTFELLGRSGRSYLLSRGAVSDASRFVFDGQFQSPTLSWPDDRAWFVHTEIDASSTYVGGPRAMIDRLVGEQILESFEVQPDTPVVW